MSKPADRSQGTLDSLVLLVIAAVLSAPAAAQDRPPPVGEPLAAYADTTHSVTLADARTDAIGLTLARTGRYCKFNLEPQRCFCLSGL